MMLELAQHYGVHHFEAVFKKRNQRSQRLLERLGFIRTGSSERTWNVGGVWKDSLYYALSRADRAAATCGQAPA